jgi:hypothetical protein
VETFESEEQIDLEVALKDFQEASQREEQIQSSLDQELYKAKHDLRPNHKLERFTVG